MGAQQLHELALRIGCVAGGDLGFLRRPALGGLAVELDPRVLLVAQSGSVQPRRQRGDGEQPARGVAGLRASEIVSRRVADLDEDQAPGDLFWIPCSKTAAGRRQLEVPDVLRPLLARLASGKAPDRYLFERERKHERGTGKPHGRDWIIDQVHRICGLAAVPSVTAHAMRGLLATLMTERGMAGHLVAATLGHADERTTMGAYARPGSAAAGARARGIVMLDGGLPAEKGPK